MFFDFLFQPGLQGLFEIPLEVGFRGAAAVGRVGERCVGAQGDVIGVSYVVFNAQIHQAQNRLIGVGVVGQEGGVKSQRIRLLIAYDQIAVAVGNVAAGGLHGSGAHDLGHRLAAVFCTVDNLEIEHYGKIAGEHGEDEQYQYHNTVFGQFLRFGTIHGSPFIRSGSACAGRCRGKKSE